MKTLRVDRLGSLLRPEPLKQAFRQFASGRRKLEVMLEVSRRVWQ
jgi:hypothetical protein